MLTFSDMIDILGPSLSEFLSDILEPNTPICVGAVNGSGYIFFGSSSELDKLLQTFSHYDLINRGALSTTEDHSDILSRKVVNSFVRETDGTTAILVEGFEKCGFWFKSEYDRWYEKTKHYLNSKEWTITSYA